MPQIGDKKTGKNRNRFIWHACVDCGKERWVTIIRESKPGNLRCRSCENRGERNHNWRGGVIYSQGYKYIRLDASDFFYPMTNKVGYILEHRLVVAKALGRCLLPWETVHHKEGVPKDDNRYPETLELLPSQSTHFALTRMANYIKKLEREIERLTLNEAQAESRRLE